MCMRFPTSYRDLTLPATGHALTLFSAFAPAVSSVCWAELREALGCLVKLARGMRLQGWAGQWDLRCNPQDNGELFLSKKKKLESNRIKRFKKKITLALAGVVQLVGAWSRKPQGCGFDFQSGHRPRLWVWSPVGLCIRRQPLSKINKHVLQWG